MARETNTPQIPQVTADNLVEVVRTLKEIAEVREGRRGDDLDEAVTYRDLVSLGLVKKLADGGYGDNTGTADLPVTTPVDDSNVPPAPINFVVRAVYNVVVLSWTVPSYRNHGATEVWRARVDDLARAVKIGDTAGTQFTDPPGDGGMYWYWVRNVSMAGVPGPYNSQGGTAATVTGSVADVLTDIAASVENSSLVRDLRARVDGLETGTFVPSYLNDVVVRSESLARESLTLVSKTDSNLAYVQQLMETANGLSAKYTLKVGVGGHVAGFGAAAYKNEAGGTTSEFAVMANRFAVVPPADEQASAPTTNLFRGKVWVDTSVTPNVTRYWTGSGGVPSAGLAANIWTTNQAAALVPFAVYTAPSTLPSGKTVQPGVYMDSAFIAELQADKITSGSIAVGQYIQSQNYVPGSSGWKIHADGSAAFNSITLRGAVMGGAFTGWGWPTVSTGGFYLGPEGLLLGTNGGGEIGAGMMVAGKRYRIKSLGTAPGQTPTNFVAVGAPENAVNAQFIATGAATGDGTVVPVSYFQVFDNGDVSASGFYIVNGKMTIGQIDVIGTTNIVTGAVSTPNGAEVTANTLVSTTTLTTYLATTLNTEGRGLWVYCNFSLVGTATVQYELIANGSILFSGTVYSRGIVVSNNNQFNTGFSEATIVTLTKFIQSPGAGSIAVELKLKDATGLGVHIMSGSSLFVIGTKR